jgi:hypothetical protein
MNTFQSKENIKITNKLLELNTFQSKKFTLTTKPSKKLNKFQSPELTLITIPLNTKLNMFHKLTTPPSLNMFHNKDHMLNKSQLPELLLNTSVKPDTPLNTSHNKDKLKMLNTFQSLNKSSTNQPKLKFQLFHKLFNHNKS